jgi:hypothetical protein
MFTCDDGRIFLMSKIEEGIIMPGNQTIVEVLRETSRLLERKGWNKFSMARGPFGQGVGPNSNAASCYCVCGALVKAWRTVDPQNEDFYFRYFEKKLADVLHQNYGYGHTFTRWNDEVAACRDDVVSFINSVIASILEDDPAAGPYGDLLAVGPVGAPPDVVSGASFAG